MCGYAAHAAETEEQDEIKAFNIKVNRVRVLRTIGQQVEDKVLCIQGTRVTSRF